MSGNDGVDLGIPGIEQAVEVGRGGFGVVYRAAQPRLERTVAVKVLPVRPDARARERFERECRALGALSGHPNTVTVFDSGFTEGGQPYLVMEYMADGSLGDRLRRDDKLPWDEAAAIGVKLAGAVEMAHRSGVLHRDVKPENVLVSSYGEPCLTDFGLARLQGGTASRTGSVTTSLAHAAPEVIEGRRPSEAADVYSVASTVFELLSGRPAFVHDTDETLIPVLARIATAPVPDLRPSGVPDGVCTVLESAMAKDPEQRPSSAGEFGAALQDAQRRAGSAVSDMQLTDVAPAALVDLTGDDGPTTGPVRTSSYIRPNRDAPPPKPESVPTTAVPAVSLGVSVAAKTEASAVGEAEQASALPEVEPEPTVHVDPEPEAPTQAEAIVPSVTTAERGPDEPAFTTTAPTPPSVGAVRETLEGIEPANPGTPSRPPRRAMLIGAGAVVTIVALIGGLLISTSSGGSDKVSTGEDASVSSGVVQFGTVTLPSGLKLDRSWRITGPKGGTLDARMKVTNSTDKPLADTYEEVIPKELAKSVADVTFVGSTPTTVKADPIVSYTLSVEPGKTTRFGYTIAVLAKGRGPARLDAWKDAWVTASTARKKELDDITKYAAALDAAAKQKAEADAAAAAAAAAATNGEVPATSNPQAPPRGNAGTEDNGDPDSAAGPTSPPPPPPTISIRERDGWHCFETGVTAYFHATTSNSSWVQWTSANGQPTGADLAMVLTNPGTTGDVIAVAHGSGGTATASWHIAVVAVGASCPPGYGRT